MWQEAIPAGASRGCERYMLLLLESSILPPWTFIDLSVCDKQKANNPSATVYSYHLSTPADCTDWQWFQDLVLHANIEVSFAQSSINLCYFYFSNCSKQLNSSPQMLRPISYRKKTKLKKKKKNIQYQIYLCVPPRQGTTNSHC